MIYRTIKTSLKSILKDEKLIQPQIIIQSYQFLRLYNTSKKCCGCHNNLKSKEFLLLTCSKCMSYENKNIVFRTRDVNSSINTRNIFRFYLINGKRPDAFLSSSPSQNEGLS